MDEREAARLLAGLASDLTLEGEYRVRHEDFVMGMPQSGERIRGRERMREFQGARSNTYTSMSSWRYEPGVWPVAGALGLSREAHSKNANFVFSRASSEPNRHNPCYDRRRIAHICWQILASGAIDCEGIVPHDVPFSGVPEAYEPYVDRNPERATKLGIRF
jgi:hypothetical protein